MLWLLLNIFFTLSTRAESYYIQTTGIDELDPKKNYTQFYQDAQGFEKYCSINTDIKCKLYLDQDLKRLLKPEMYAETLKPIKGKYEAPTRDKVLKEMQSAVENANPGDQVVLSFSDHGGPGEISPSCMYLSRSDKICVDDVEAILKKKKPGVRVLVATSGCFSGSFADLSSSEICVRTTASRQKYGYAKENSSLWNYFLKMGMHLSKHKRELQYVQNSAAQLNASGTSISSLDSVTGSQFITNELCNPIRKDLEAQGTKYNGSFLSVTYVRPDVACQKGTRDQILQLREVYQNIQTQSDFYRKTYNLTCNPVSRERRFFCEALQNILSPDSSTRKVSDYFDHAMAEKKQRLDDLFVEQEAIISKLKKLANTPQALAEKARRKRNPEKYFGPNWNVEGQPDFIFETGLTPEMKGLEAKYDDLSHRIENIDDEIEAKIKTNIPPLKDVNNFSKNLLIVNICLSPGFERPTAEELQFLNGNLPFVLHWNNYRKFTPKDLEDARQCESKFML